VPLRKVAAILLLSVLFGTSGAGATYMASDSDELRGTYVGTLRCAGCSGARTRLFLLDSGPDLGFGFGTFILQELSELDDDRASRFVTAGTWFVLNIHTFDWFHTTGPIELQPHNADGSASRPLFFLCTKAKELQPLDDTLKPIPSAEPLRRLGDR